MTKMKLIHSDIRGYELRNELDIIKMYSFSKRQE